MAKVGGGAAFQRLQKPNDGLAQNLTQFAMLRGQRAGAAMRQKRQLKASEDAGKQNRIGTLLEEAKVSLNSLENFDAKDKNLNELNISWIEQTKERLRDAWFRRIEAEKSGDEKAKIKAISDIASLDDTAKNIEAFEQTAIKHFGAEEAGLSSGSKISNPEYDEIKNSLFSTDTVAMLSNGLVGGGFQAIPQMVKIKGQPVIDENNMPSIVYERPDGSKDIIGIAEFMNKSLPSNYDYKDSQSMFQGYKKIVNTFEESVENGTVTETTKGLSPDSFRMIDADSKSLYAIDDNGRLTNHLASYAKENSIPLNEVDENTVEQARNWFINGAQGLVASSRKSEIDHSARVAYDKNNRARAKDEAELITPQIAMDTQSGEPEVRKITKDDGTTVDANVVILGNNGIKLPPIDNVSRKLERILRADDGEYYGDVIETRIIPKWSKHPSTGEPVMTKQSEEKVVTKKLSTTDLNDAVFDKKMVNDNGDIFKNAVEFEEFATKKIKSSKNTKNTKTNKSSTKQDIEGWN